MQYIPQRAPFVMIDEIVSTSEKVTQTQFTVREGHLFVENNFFTEPGLVENMAQTAGAGTGYKAHQDGKPTPLGFIGALKGLQVKELPKVGDTITTETTLAHRVMSVFIVEARILLEGREIASCEFKIFLQS